MTATPPFEDDTPYQRDTVAVFGIPFDRLTLDDAANRLRAAALGGQRLWLSTVNLDWVVMAREDPAFEESILASDMVTCDGAPLVKLSGLAGAPLPERVTGADLFEALRRPTADGGRPIRTFFFGGRDDSAAKAHAALQEQSAGLISVGAVNPGFGDLDSLSSDELIDQINASDAEFLIVALGAKKGQGWIARNRDRLSAPVVAHLGAVVDFAAGAIERAPGVAQKLSMEWAWRIGQDPALAKRYAKDAALLPVLTREALQIRRAMKTARAEASGPPVIALEGNRLSVSGVITVDSGVAALGDALSRAEATSTPLQVDIDARAFLDFCAMGLLLTAMSRFRDRYLAFDISATSPALRSLLHLNRLPLSSARFSVETGMSAKRHDTEPARER